MDSVCIIPARGGSKRIPRKNIRTFHGKPMIAWSIEAASAACVFERIVVSTEDDEVAEISRTLGAEVPFKRPMDIADDFAGTDEVFKHALSVLGVKDGSACCLYATAPLVRAEDLRKGFDLIRDKGCASAFSVVKYAYPIYRAMKVNDAGRLEMLWPEHRDTRSQDLPEVWHDAGQFYWVDVDKYLPEGRLFGPDACPVELPTWRVQDIDTEEDWLRAEQLFETIGRKAP